MDFSFGVMAVIVLIPAISLSIYASRKVRLIYNKFLQIESRGGKTGKEAAEIILQNNEITDVAIEAIDGGMTDHYDPGSKVLRLSKLNYYGKSLSAVGVAAHEAGHAIQHNVGYRPLRLRSGVVPMSQFGSYISFPLIFAGFIFSMPKFSYVGMMLYATIVGFTLVTLPVEFNASLRAVQEIQRAGILDDNELNGAKKVLNAAALTYVAAASVAILQLIRLLLVTRSPDDKQK